MMAALPVILEFLTGAAGMVGGVISAIAGARGLIWTWHKVREAAAARAG